MTTVPLAAGRRESQGAWLSGAGHRISLNLFMVVVLAHWAEHLTQAFQIYALGRPIPQSRGVLGQFFPWLIKSEWLHYGYALVMVIGLFILRNGFTGRSRTWWMVAFGIQFWHHVEHLLLFIQAQTATPFFGQAVPTSVAQLVLPRVELHLLYNTIVFIPMVVAMWLHLRPTPAELDSARCNCARRPSLAPA